MQRLPSLVASVAVTALVLLAQTSTAYADTPAVDTVPVVPAIPASAPVAAPMRLALTTTSTAAMGSLMVVLDVLGIVEKNAPAKPAAATRTATFLSPDPPKTPLFYSSLTVAKF